MSTPYSFHHPFSSLTRTVLDPLVARGATIFIETGTNVGLAVQLALDAGFELAYTVEEDIDIHRVACDRFLSNPNVSLFCGDSPFWLAKILSFTRSARSVVYLDAHSVARNPLLEELDAIIASGVIPLAILIDDVRMFGTPDWHGLAQIDAIRKLNEINPDYELFYADTPNAPGDLLVAMVP